MRLRARRLARTQLRVLLALAALLAAPGIAAEGALAAKPVSYGAIVAQIEQGPVVRAVINPSLRHVEIKFRDLSEWLAVYPPGAQPQLQRLLHRRHIRIVFASGHRPQHRRAVHHLRYIAAGILVAALATVGAVLALDGRRRRRREPRAQTPPG
jgi:hypothetical protein